MSDWTRGLAEPDYMSFLKTPVILPTKSALETHAENNFASEFHKRLQDWIVAFDQSLDNEHEVGIRLVSFGQTVQFHLQSMGYWNPSLICFVGCTENGEPVQLIQHVSQISVLLMKVPRKDPSQPKRKIGFGVESDQPESRD